MGEETTIGGDSYGVCYFDIVFYIVSMIAMVVIYRTFFNDDANSVKKVGKNVGPKSPLLESELKGEPALVASIDFGTCFCTWAYSETKPDPKDSGQSSAPVASKKVPTSALIESDGKTLKAFGDEAEKIYKELASKGQHKEYYYFLRFKMALDKEKISREILIEDIMGKTLPATRVFSLSIEYISNELIQMGKENVGKEVTRTDFHWALSVPAIWSDAAKQFMREAATEAHLSSKDISIGFDTDASAVICRDMMDAKNESDNRISECPPGTRYMVIDAGGGNVQMSVHEVGSTGELKEITVTTGHSMGGNQVDTAFKQVLVDVFGQDAYTTFKEENTSDWLQLWYEFEEQKQPFDPNVTPNIEITIPSTLIKLTATSTNMDLRQILRQSKYSSELEASGNGLQISSKLMIDMFDKPLKKTVALVKSGLQMVEGVTRLFMTGGFSASPSLQHAIKKVFPEMEIIVIGAVIVRHEPEAITQRVLKKTYGIELEGKQFSKHGEKGQHVTVGEFQPEQGYYPAYPNQNAIKFQLFASDEIDPKYTNEGCTLLGAVTLDISDVPGDMDRKVFAALCFGDTEIKITARAEKTDKTVSGKCDFLE